MSRRFRPRRRQITGRRPVHYELRFFPPKIYIKRSKRSKKGHKLHFFMFLPVSDYVSKISSPKVTKSRAVGPSTMNDGPKARLYMFCRRRRPSTGRRPVHRCGRCKYFVAEGDEITAVGPVTTNHGPKAHLISSPKVTKPRAEGPSTMNNGPKARLYRFRGRRRRSTGRWPVNRCRRCKYIVTEGDEITGRRPVNYERRAEGPSVQISSSKATIDGPEARLPTSTMPIFRRRRR